MKRCRRTKPAHWTRVFGAGAWTAVFVPLASAAPLWAAPTSPSVAATAPEVSPPPANSPPSVAAQPTNVPPPEPVWSTCRESVPPGKTPPALTEEFPAQVPAGHAATLKVTLTHGKGERVLADAFELQRDSEGAKALRQSGFEFPAASSPARPRVTRTEGATEVTTVVEIAVLPLPKQSGATPATLPPLPIAVARASGEVMTLCTSPHAITITDPTANVPNAEPRRHPGGERQEELWVGLRNVTYGALLGMALAALGYLVVRWFQKRPRALPPPPPPRPAWEVALTAIADLRQSDLLASGKFTSHLERVNHVLRQYLGGRFGFDGLESTTEEVLVSLRASSLPTALFAQTEHMLRESDLVKFAKIVPTEAQCRTALDEVEGLVRRTMHADAGVIAAEASTASVLGAPIRGVAKVPATTTVPASEGGARPLAPEGEGSLVIAEAPGRGGSRAVPPEGSAAGHSDPTVAAAPTKDGREEGTH